MAIRCPKCKGVFQPGAGPPSCPHCGYAPRRAQQAAPAQASAAPMQWAPPQAVAYDPAAAAYHAGVAHGAQMVGHPAFKKAKHAFQEGILAIVFGALGILGPAAGLFILIGLVCGIAAIVNGSSARKTARQMQWAELAQKAHNGMVMGIVGTCLAVILPILSFTLLFSLVR